MHYQRSRRDSCWLTILCGALWKTSTWYPFCLIDKPSTCGEARWSSWKCSSYCQNVSNHWMHYEIRSDQEGGAWAMLCASKFLYDRLWITRQNMPIQPCRPTALSQSSVILYLFVLQCICRRYTNSAVFSTKCDHRRMFRVTKTRISWFGVIGWNQKTSISLSACSRNWWPL